MRTQRPKDSKDTRTQRRNDTRIQGQQDVMTQGHNATRIQGQQHTRTQGYKDTSTLGKTTKIVKRHNDEITQRFKNPKCTRTQ